MTDAPAPTLDSRGPWARLPFGIVLAAICLNALWFAVKAANPVLISDTWHFVSSLVLPYAQGDFSVGDLFAKRGATDHSQPLRKLLLLMNYEWFDLDLAIDAIFGVVAAWFSLIVMWRVARRARRPRTRATPLECAAFLTLAATYLSLSSTAVFSWPLVATSFTNHPFLLLFGWAAWEALERPDAKRLALLFAAGMFLSVIADDTGLVATIAVSLAAVLYGLRLHKHVSVLAVAGISFLGYVAYAALFALVSKTPGQGAGALSMEGVLGALAGSWGKLLPLIEAPLAGAVVQRGDIAAWPGGAYMLALLTLALALGHVWFWAMALVGRKNAATFVSVTLMLFFYGLLAGIFFTRAREYGADYLWQPRYSIFYRWSLVALFLMTIGQLADRPGEIKSQRQGTAVRVMARTGLLLLAAQIPLSFKAWQSIPFLEKYQQREAVQIMELSKDPRILPKSCMPAIVVCKFNPEERASLLWFLKSQNLNVFNEAIRRRHGLATSD